MTIFGLIIKNSMRRPTRLLLTALGVCVALLAFALVTTLLDAWYREVRQSNKDRLITRNAVSLVFDLPVAYGQKIQKIPGIGKVGYGNWFGGKYGDGRYMFQQFAIGGEFLELYPELHIAEAEKQDFLFDRKGALIGKDIADRLGKKIGDVIQLEGTIYPGQWEFNVKGIFTRATNGDTRAMYFHWDYLNEKVRSEKLMEPDHVSFFAEQLLPGANAANVSKDIDSLFANTYAETLTETETAFLQGFLSMSSAILYALRVVSFIVLLIMLLVMTNTIMMSARERFREYAVLKALGFGKLHVVSIVFGEALVVCLLGYLLLCAALAPIFGVILRALPKSFFDFVPELTLEPKTLIYCLLISLTTAVFAGLVPAYTVFRLKVTDGLRRL